MTPRSDYGWHDDLPCPDWCTSTDHHLGERILQGQDHFWHKGAPKWVRTEEQTPNCEPIDAEVYVLQHVVVDERGFNTRPAEVSLECAGRLTPANARRLAGALLDIADRADNAWTGQVGPLEPPEPPDDA